MHPQLIRDTPGVCHLCGMDLIPTSDLGFANEPVPNQEVITVPRDALLIAGSHAVVYVETDPGRFEIRQVTVGEITRERAVIAAGIASEETVALNGNFLIDSQMQLSGNPSLIDPDRAPAFSNQPLSLPVTVPLVFDGDVGDQIDRIYQLYFNMQTALASDAAPNGITQNTLLDGLARLEKEAEIPKRSLPYLSTARQSVSRLGGSIEDWRKDFRSVSHSFLRLATEIRGPETAKSLVHYHCTMVPGYGGDWLQSAGNKKNPYWGSKMLECGDLVRDLSINALGSGTEQDKDAP